MKREPLTRPALALHEAGHLMAMALLDEPGMFHWRRLSGYEIAHVAERQAQASRWNDPSGRDAMIARRTVIALAGGAAERSATRFGPPADTLAAIHACTGAVDLELAHEWLTLQRYDGDQAAIIDDITRLFGELTAFFAHPDQRRTIAQVAARIEAVLVAADRDGRSDVCIPATDLMCGIVIGQAPAFVLRETIRPGPERRAS